MVSGGKWVEGAGGICTHRDTQRHTDAHTHTHTPTYIRTHRDRQIHRLDNFCVVVVVVVVVVAVGWSFVHVCGRPPSMVGDSPCGCDSRACFLNSEQPTQSTSFLNRGVPLFPGHYGYGKCP